MEKFVHFVMNHWLLWVALVIILALIIFEEVKNRLLGVTQIPPQALTRKFNLDEAVAIDVRDRKAYDQGHIISAISIPATELEANLKKLEKYKNQNLVIVDESGNANRIAAKLRAKGFNTSILTGGMNGWRTAGLPLSKK